MEEREVVVGERVGRRGRGAHEVVSSSRDPRLTPHMIGEYLRETGVCVKLQ